MSLRDYIASLSEAASYEEMIKSTGVKSHDAVQSKIFHITLPVEDGDIDPEDWDIKKYIKDPEVQAALYGYAIYDGMPAGKSVQQILKSIGSETEDIIDALNNGSDEIEDIDFKIKNNPYIEEMLKIKGFKVSKVYQAFADGTPALWFEIGRDFVGGVTPDPKDSSSLVVDGSFGDTELSIKVKLSDDRKMKQLIKVLSSMGKVSIAKTIEDLNKI